MSEEEHLVFIINHRTKWMRHNKLRPPKNTLLEYKDLLVMHRYFSSHNRFEGLEKYPLSDDCVNTVTLTLTKHEATVENEIVRGGSMPKNQLNSILQTISNSFYKTFIVASV